MCSALNTPQAVKTDRPWCHVENFCMKITITQLSFPQFGPYEISVLSQLTLSHQRSDLTNVSPQFTTSQCVPHIGTIVKEHPAVMRVFCPTEEINNDIFFKKKNRYFHWRQSSHPSSQNLSSHFTKSVR